MASELFVVANLIVSSAGGYIALCRLAKMSHSTTKLVIRWQYVVWFCLFAASGWSFLLFDPADFIQLLMSSGILTHLLLGAPAWHGDTPHYVRLNGQAELVTNGNGAHSGRR